MCFIVTVKIWFNNVDISILLQPKWSDLDVNQHVNNVKYIGWILEVHKTNLSIPSHLLLVLSSKAWLYISSIVKLYWSSTERPATDIRES